MAALNAAAAPSIGDLRSRVAAIQAEVAQIEDQVSIAAEAYNGARYRLDEVQARIARNRRTLQKATRDLARARDLLAERVRAAYVTPPPTQLELLLSSGSLSSLMSGADAIERVSTQDTAIIRSVQRLRTATLAARKGLLADEKTARAELVDRTRQRDVVLGLLGRRQAVLAGAQGELGRLLAAERARQRRAEQAEQRRALERARSTPGSAAAPAPAQPAAAPSTPAPSSGGGSGSGGGPTITAGPASAANAQAARIALRYLGVPYRWGGASPSTGFDCSGLASFAYAQVGKSVPHYTGAIWAKFPRVSGPLQAGDLVFYRGLGHMGIYIGGGQMVHAPRTGDVVKITAMSTRSDYVGAVRP